MSQRDEQVCRFVGAVLRRLQNAGRPVTESGVADVCRQLLRLARSIHRLDEASCNYELTPRQVQRQIRLEERAKELATELGSTLYLQGDPRGWPLYLVWPQDVPAGGEIDAYYNRGVGVPV